MHRTSFKIFLACVFGAGLGTFLALEFGPNFWWLGASFGGLVGYIAYDFKAVLQAIPKAWKKAKAAQKAVDWSLKYQQCRIIFLVEFYIVGIIGLLIILITPSPLPSRFWLIFATPLIATIPSVMLNLFSKKDCQKIYPRVDPRRLVVYYLPRGFRWIATKVIPDATVFLRKFCWHLFLQIHGEFRLLCGLDAMIGAGIGYFAGSGSAIIGALAGGIIGVFNYAYITKRWLEPKGFLPLKANT